MTQNFKESIRFECSPSDKTLLRKIAIRNGGASMSAIMRRLIHDEASRLHIANTINQKSPQPVRDHEQEHDLEPA